MKTDIRVGDKVKWVGSSTKIYTVLEIGEDGRYLVTHPEMLYPRSGMWLSHWEIIQLFQERDIK
jgi:hypothetical protein